MKAEAGLPERHFTIESATPSDREAIYAARHEVYAAELGQHLCNPEARLQDALDDSNVYFIARTQDSMAGFVSVTPPSAGRYSIDKYFQRSALPFTVNERTFEVRLLTVLKPHRGDELAFLLMYAVLRWVESHAGSLIVAIGRHEILDLYLRSGLQSAGHSVQSGAVTYDLLYAQVSVLREGQVNFPRLLARTENRTHWRLSIPFHKPAPCFHGGAFFSAISERFDFLERSNSIINADVLDAWFPPISRCASRTQ